MKIAGKNLLRVQRSYYHQIISCLISPTLHHLIC